MPWWSWILIWIALVALSLLFFGVLGVRLYRQFMTTLKELGEAAERLSRPPSGAAGSAAADAADTDPASRPLPGSAVLAPPALMRDHYHASRYARKNARRLRRIQRKRGRGQPQALRDIDLG